jgi:hypothetical protein
MSDEVHGGLYPLGKPKRKTFSKNLDLTPSKSYEANKRYQTKLSEMSALYRERGGEDHEDLCTMVDGTNRSLLKLDNSYASLFQGDKMMIVSQCSIASMV